MRIRGWDPELGQTWCRGGIESESRVVREARLIREKPEFWIFLYKQKSPDMGCFGPRNPYFSGRFRFRFTPVLVPIIRLRALSHCRVRFLARERVTENLAGPARTPGSPDGPVSSRGLVLVFVVEGLVDGVFEVVVEHVGHVGVLVVVVVVLVLSAHAPDGDYA